MHLNSNMSNHSLIIGPSSSTAHASDEDAMSMSCILAERKWRQKPALCSKTCIAQGSWFRSKTLIQIRTLAMCFKKK